MRALVLVALVVLVATVPALAVPQPPNLGCPSGFFGIAQGTPAGAAGLCCVDAITDGGELCEIYLPNQLP